MSRVIVITGASEGIGALLARRLGAKGDSVVLGARRRDKLDQVAGESGDSALAVVTDATKRDEIERLRDAALDRFGHIDVWVNNAGRGIGIRVMDFAEDDLDEMLAVNLKSAWYGMKAAIPHFQSRGRGHVINISSVLGLIPGPYMASYVATKHAIEGYSESLDHEVREHGVRVLLVEPAYTKTGFDANALQPDAPLTVYAEQRQVFDGVMATAMAAGDDPATVAKAIVAAAIDPKPKLRYTAGSTARRVSTLRRFVPARAFDRQIRKLNHLPA